MTNIVGGSTQNVQLVNPVVHYYYSDCMYIVHAAGLDIIKHNTLLSSKKKTLIVHINNLSQIS